MAKEILLYEYISNYSAASIIKEMEASKGEDIVFRVNSPGGSVLYAYGIYAKYSELTKSKKVKVDGAADSCAAFLCCYAEDVECLDISTFTFHRASYGSYFEGNPALFTDEAKASLATLNKNFRAAMEGKMRDEDFKKVTGYSYDELFSLDTRIDVEINAKQAEKLGLVNKVTKITPAKKAEVAAMVYQVAASRSGFDVTAEIEEKTNQNFKTTTIMTLAEFKAANPAGYAEAKAEGHNEGVLAERDRVGAYMAFVDVDAEAIKKGITEGTVLSHTEMAELSRKSFAKATLDKAVGENAIDINTGEAKDAPTVEAAKVSAFEAELLEKLKKVD